MESNYNLVMLWAAVLSSIYVVPSVIGATYTVGDNTGWDTPTGGDPYATWASQHTFVVGDVLVFNFNTGSHTVANVTSSAFSNCNTGNPLSIQTNGPASFTIDTIGSHYFICTILNHCSLNQKLTITADANTDDSLSPESPPTSSPSSPPVKSDIVVVTVATGMLFLMFMIIGLF